VRGQCHAPAALYLRERPGTHCTGGWVGPSSVGRGQAGRPDQDQQHCYHHAPKVKPKAAIAVVELLMMGVRTPETC
jgi:hypothetical protein